MFNHFEGFFHRFKQEARHLRREQYEDILYEFLHRDGKQADGSLAQIGIQAILEMTHYYVSHRVFYIKTGFAQCLMESMFEVPPSKLCTPYDLFEISFEDDFEILPGVKTPSALVCYRPFDSTISAMEKFLRKSTEYYSVHNENPTAFVHNNVRHSLRFHYKSPFADALCHIAVPIDNNVGGQIKDVIDRVGMFNDPLAVEMDDNEREISKRIAQIIFGVQCYLSTSDPDLYGHNDRNRPGFGIRPNGFILGSSFERTVGWHLRKPHRRFLRDERFSRDEDGSVRCVWVRGAEINPQAKPGAHKKVDVLPKQDE